MVSVQWDVILVVVEWARQNSFGLSMEDSSRTSNALRQFLSV